MHTDVVTLYLYVHTYVHMFIHLNISADCVYFEAYINKPTAKLPYSKLTQYRITMEGLPAGLSLKHPSSYGKDMLKEILSKKDQLKIKGSYVK